MALLLLHTGTAAPFQAGGTVAAPGAIQGSGTIEVVFTPGSDREAAGRLLVQLIDSARRTVLIQAFTLTHRKIANALVAARARGVEVALIADEEQTRNAGHSLVPEIAARGVPTFVDGEHASAHNKIMIIDPGTSRPTVVTGSFNFTQAAQYRNAENLLIFRNNAPLTAEYLANWRHHQAHSRPFLPHH